MQVQASDSSQYTLLLTVIYAKNRETKTFSSKYQAFQYFKSWVKHSEIHFTKPKHQLSLGIFQCNHSCEITLKEFE